MANTLVQLKDPNDSSNTFYPITTANAVYCDDGTGTPQNPSLRSLQSYIDEINSYSGGGGGSITSVTGSNIVLSTSSSNYLTVNGANNYTISLPSTIPATWLGSISTTAASGDHTHGDITNSGTIVTSAVSPGANQNLVITSSNTVKKSNISFDTSNTTHFLRKDGTWQVPAGGGGGGGSTVTAYPNQNAVTGGYPVTIGVEVGKVTIDNVTTSFIIDPAQSGYDDSSLPGEQLPWVLPMGAVRPIATTHGLIDYESSTPAFIGKKVEPPALNKITRYWTDLTKPGELENGLIAIPVLTDIGPVYIDERSQVRITESVPYILLPSDLVTGKGQALFEILGGLPISEK